MQSKAGCLICGEDLIYVDSEEITCQYCGKSYFTNAKCVQGHFICDSCHSSSGNDLIEKHCISTSSENPYEIALVLMKHPAVKMHGPEHHFLVPAVLIAAYYNRTGDDKLKFEKIREARKRAEKIPGGACGFHGSCGAAVGTGIFISLIKDTTPLSVQEWKKPII